jgi:hypothetical protein
MKRIKFLLALLVMLIPTIVLADMSAPMSSYKVRVTNPEGAYFYEYDSKQSAYVKTDNKFDYDTILTVSYEMKMKDYILVDACDEKDWCGSINLSNTKPLDVKLDDYYREYTKKYLVFDKSCELYTGPSRNAYDKVSSGERLEVGYKFATNYYDDLYAYVPEKNAWVYIYSYSFETEEEPSGLLEISDTISLNILAMKELKLYDSPKDNGTVIATIPVDTIVSATNEYRFEPHEPIYYVTYNGKSGFVKPNYDKYIDNMAFDQSGYIYTTANKDGVKVYQEPSKSSKVITTIPDNTQVRSRFVLYKSFEIGDGVYMMQMKYNDQIGWVVNSEENFDYDKTIYDENVPEPVTPTEPESNPDIIKDPVNFWDQQLSVKEVIIICIGLVLIISIAGIVSIRLINKKKTVKDTASKKDIKVDNKDTNNPD